MDEWVPRLGTGAGLGHRGVKAGPVTTGAHVGTSYAWLSV